MDYAISEESFDSVASYWNDKEQRLQWNSVFLLPAWLSVCWHVFRADAKLCLFAVKHQDDVIGIAPLKVENGTACFIGSADLCDYMDFILRPGMETHFFDIVLDHLKENGVRKLDLRALRPDSTVVACLAGLAQERGYQVLCGPEDISLEKELPSKWEEYLDGLPGKERHELRRKLRRLYEAGDIDYLCLKEGNGTDGTLDTFLRLFTASREDKARFMNPQTELFFRLITAAMADTGMLRFGILTLDKLPVAIVLGFDFNNTFHLYNSGYDPAYSSLSVGLISKALSIRHAINEGKQKYDFLKGDEKYKYHLGGREIPVYRCQITLQ